MERGRGHRRHGHRRLSRPERPGIGPVRRKRTPGGRTLSGSCGLAAEPLSSRFADDGGTDACFDGAEPSLEVENERDEPIEAAVEISVGGADGPVLAERYELDPGERTVERRALPAHGERTAQVTIDGGTESGSWEEPSCYRHGIGIGPDGIGFGLVEPMSGLGDTQHDCYAGDDAIIRIYNDGTERTVRLQVVDHCAGTTAVETFGMEPDGVESVRGAIVNGGVYDVTVSAEDGGEETFEFANDCGGLLASIDGDGAVAIREMAID
ncbi:hypothetical protein [Halalkalicoccus jeotgali]|uniref:Uncharacterized protein n=1 Tax=Halalkalicoccus jeotgali (strain DSM 18796 / CECT 7217 / JCM 14584 / KCTC 4019 / B3) TaxID=795797 RepID=D8J8A3_HALJB|nr:hypothetical protein [Halalkalicoccus jeotgali]ADJ16149.1 hypothetical protein HacjB3_13840 [Halalkalicoccus jeotgali B3]ELY37578.1 hypothetical protein C497_09053 [Halalkalicoccus jeotgali B3]